MNLIFGNNILLTAHQMKWQFTVVLKTIKGCGSVVVSMDDTSVFLFVLLEGMICFVQIFEQDDRLIELHCICWKATVALVCYLCKISFDLGAVIVFGETDKRQTNDYLWLTYRHDFDFSWLFPKTNKTSLNYSIFYFSIIPLSLSTNQIAISINVSISD